jgi:cytochrome c biogenesis protein CcmG/thiol:disulfide interchange protein DsbE
VIRLALVILAAFVLVPAPPVMADDASPLLDLKLEPLGEEATTLGALAANGPVLLDFWATWCRPCVAAIPELNALHERYRKQGFTVVGISVDGPRNYAKVKPFVSRMAIHYPIVLDEDGSLARVFQVTSVPAAFLLDRSGRVVRVQNGYRPGEADDLDEAVRELLGGDDPR